MLWLCRFKIEIGIGEINMSFMKSNLGRVTLMISAATILVLGFQNCGPGMNALNSGSNSSSSTQGTGGGSLKEVSLAWDANSEPELTGYVIHYGTQMGGPYDQSVDVGLTPSPTAPAHKITGLDSATTYYFVVSAYDGSHVESSFSNEVSK